MAKTTKIKPLTAEEEFVCKFCRRIREYQGEEWWLTVQRILKNLLEEME